LKSISGAIGRGKSWIPPAGYPSARIVRHNHQGYNIEIDECLQVMADSVLPLPEIWNENAIEGSCLH
jgi:hypothetical protein